MEQQCEVSLSTDSLGWLLLTRVCLSFSFLQAVSSSHHEAQCQCSQQGRTVRLSSHTRILHKYSAQPLPSPQHGAVSGATSNSVNDKQFLAQAQTQF